jgi:hypothetical protein
MFLTAFSPETPPVSSACYPINLVRSWGSRVKTLKKCAGRSKKEIKKFHMLEFLRRVCLSQQVVKSNQVTNYQ